MKKHWRIFFNSKNSEEGKEKANFSAVCFLFPPNTLRFLCAIKKGPRIPGLGSVFPWGRSNPLRPPGSFQSADSSNMGWPTQKWSILLTDSKHMCYLWRNRFWKKGCTVCIWKRGGYFQKLLWEGKVIFVLTWRAFKLGFYGEPHQFLPPYLPTSFLSLSLSF